MIGERAVPGGRADRVMDGFWIGGVEIPGRWILGPMAGVTDLPFRLLCREQGASLVCTEMISAKGIDHHNKNTEQLMQTDERERPVSLQLFGSDPELMARIAAQIEQRDFDILDINMGCPVPKVVNNGEGSALMKDPELAGRIVSAVSRAISKPVTVKIRKGFGREECSAVSFAKRMEECGAAAVCVHGRTREQYYGGKADWDTIRQVKEALEIPVIASGDIFTPQDALRCRQETGCDGFMLARGARGNPWVFHQIRYHMDTGGLEAKPSADEMFRMVLRHARMLIEYKGEQTAMRQMRKHMAWYTAGYPGSAALRRRLGELERYEDLERIWDAAWLGRR